MLPDKKRPAVFFIILALTANDKNRYEKNTRNPASIFKGAVPG